ncbi:MAG TPA: hypothetical protein VMY98_09850 [Anaerolineae bacterium]|nr:hypothetical protein [Anaerolineae bacterium]
MTDKEFYKQIIQLLLGLIDALERWQNITPRTKEMRDAGKQTLRRGK